MTPWNLLRIARSRWTAARSRSTVRGQNRKTRLGSELLEVRTNPSNIIGSVQQVSLVGDHYVVTGTAHDPDSSTETVGVYLYLDHLSTPPNDIAAGPANLPSGGGNNWGFAITIPDQYLNNSGAVGGNHTLLAMAVDSKGGLQLSGTPLVAYGDASLSGPNNTVTVGTAGQYAGAVSSIRSGNFEYINNNSGVNPATGLPIPDDGRLEQTAMWGIPTTEPSPQALYRFNPTEAGSNTDRGTGTTSSRLQSISEPSANELTTTTQMALWTPLGTNTQPLTVNGVTYPSGLPGYNRSGGSSTLSDMVMAKDVTVGFDGRDNVIHQPVSINIPPNENIGGNVGSETGFQVIQIGYTNSSLIEKKYYSWTDGQTYATSVTSPPPLPNWEISDTTYPVIECSTDETHAIAIVSRQLTGNIRLTQAYQSASWDSSPSASDQYGWIFSKYDSPTTNPGLYLGTYSFDNYIVVGTLATVRASLQALQADGYIGPSTGWHEVNTGTFTQATAGANGQVFVEASGAGVYKIPDGATTTSAKTLADHAFFPLTAADQKGDLFGAASTGVYEFTPDAADNALIQLSNVNYSQMVADANGDLFVYQAGSGVFKIPAGSAFNARSILVTGPVSQIATDRNGDLYLLNSSGVYEVPAGTTTFNSIWAGGPGGSGTNSFDQMVVSANGDLFIEAPAGGTTPKGIYRRVAYTQLWTNGGNTIYADHFPLMAADGGGNLFLGSSSGLFEIPAGDPTSSSAPSLIVISAPPSISIPPLWIGSDIFGDLFAEYSGGGGFWKLSPAN